MKQRSIKEKSILALALGFVILLFLAPNATAFFSTPNPPPRGWRNAWPGAQGNTDVFASVDQTDNNVANINLQAFTGGPLNNPQWIGPPPPGQEWVWVVEYDITARFINPPNWVSRTEAAVESELWRISGGVRNWICTEGQRAYADNSTPMDQDTGWLYLYEANAAYQPGDIYHLHVYAQGRYFDTNYDQWNTTARQFVNLYYQI